MRALLKVSEAFWEGKLGYGGGGSSTERKNVNACGVISFLSSKCGKSATHLES